MDLALDSYGLSKSNERQFHIIEIQGRTIVVVKPAGDNQEDLLYDVASIVYSICARLYGQRRAKRKTERMLQELQGEDKHETR